MPLKLSLKPGETFVVNGAVVRNGDRRGILLLETQARILREKDILPPSAVSTAAERAYFAVMQMYLLGEVDGPLYNQTAEALAGLMAEMPDLADEVIQISSDVVAGDLYRALGRCRKLIPQPVAEAV